MPEALREYLDAIDAARRLGNDTEHTHRPALKALLDSLDDAIVATNEPRRVACGAPDYVITRRRDQLAVGYVEAKDIGVSLDETERSEQLKRYRAALPNLLLTDYLEFRWFVDGEKRATFRLAEPQAKGRLAPDLLASSEGVHLLREFLGREPIRIGGAEELAQRLARLTHLIRDVIVATLRDGHASELLTGWREVFAQTLLPEIGAQPEKAAEQKAIADFADMFAQTLAYGLFSARIMGNPARKFTRAEAEKLIPKTNPFLRDFFHLITGPQLDAEPFAGFVDDLVGLLDRADLARVLEDFGRAGRRDPVVHFYETFLSAYDPKLRELRGVYYTPEPVVGYIVRSIDGILKERFGLKDGLADKAKVKAATSDESEPEESHRVLILDPAAGTGTFLYTVIEHIRASFETKNKAGLWPGYVREHLIPRLFGFELLMAPYAIAHFKLALELDARHLGPLFQDVWRYEFGPKERLNIFLTNTLEDLEHVSQQLGPLAIVSREANEAIAVKKHRPVLVVLGNPPYSNFGRQNRNDFILGLLDDYKRGLNERKLNLDDDFIKFLRWAQWRIARTGQGVIGFITNNVYLDGLTHRRMRESLLETFDEIYILDLHGSAKKQETAPDGGKDENVFDIMVGVAIAIFVKHPPGAKPVRKKKAHAKIFHAELWGRRAAKYDWLNAHDTEQTKWTELEPSGPDFYFVPKAPPPPEYREFWSVREAFVVSGNAIKTERDRVSIHFTAQEAKTMVSDFRLKELDELRRKYDLHKDSRDWSVDRAKADVTDHRSADCFDRILYRPFDWRHTWYSGQGKGFIGTPGRELMRHLHHRDNLALCCLRQARRDQADAFFVADGLVCKDVVSPFDIGTVFPLYLYPNGASPDEESLLIREEPEARRANLSAKFVQEFAAKLGLRWLADGRGDRKKTFGPEDVLHYAYAIFHAPSYRERYAEFLRTDFPRVPLTGDPGLFRRLCERGAELVDLHLMRKDGEGTPAFPTKGNNRVEHVIYVPPEDAGRDGSPSRPGRAQRGGDPEGRRGAPSLPAGRTGRIFINATQCFEGVPPAVWSHRIGGYQVAEKWLKDRKDRTLTHDDLEHYARTLAALADTRRLMAAIEAILADHGGWPLR